MSQVPQLFHLQELDSEIDEKKQRLGDVLKALKGPASLAAAKAEAEKTAVVLKKWQTRHQDLTLENKGLRQKIKSAENRLYSGNVKNPKELEDLQHSIESMGRQRSALEDELLEAMIQLEEAEEDHTAAQENLAAEESKWETNEAKLLTEKNELAVRLGKLMDARKAAAAKIEARALKTYEGLRQKRGGTAVVRLRGDQCLGCRITVSANRIREGREGKMVYCDGCGRILYPYG